MSILVGKNTRLLVQGITSRQGAFYTQRMLNYGTRVVAGVTPGCGGQQIHGVPVYDIVTHAIAETGANASIVFTPAALATEAILEATDAGLPLIICVTEGIPQKDMVVVLNYTTARGTRLIGPNCPGIITPQACLAGVFPGNIFSPGSVGLVSHSDTLAYEVVNMLTQKGIGQSTCVGVGSDPLIGTRFVDVLPLLADDPETEVVVLLGEIGGCDEEAAAAYIQQIEKPVVAFISGRALPGREDEVAAKTAALNAAGVAVASKLADIAELVAARL